MSVWKRIKAIEQLPLLAVLIAICAIITWQAPVFITSSNILNLLRQTTQVGVCSLGLCMIALVGEIDLSISSMQAAVGIVAVWLINETGSVFLGIVSGLALSTLVGLLNAVIILKLKVVALIATLAMQTIIRGVIMIITGAASIPCDSSVFKLIGVGYWLGIPIPIYIWAFCAVCIFVLLNHTVFGRNVYAIGGNRTAAALCGINVEKYKFIIFGISGFLTGLAALILTGRMNSGQPNAGTGFEMSVISAVVLGGVSLNGGRGNVTGVIIGAFVLSVLANGMVLIGINTFWQDVIRGIILIFAVALDARRAQVARTRLIARASDANPSR